MKFRVKLKTTVTAWVEVELQGKPDIDMPGMTEWAADEGVTVYSENLRQRLHAAGMEHGPIELAHEELDESVEVVG